MSLVVLALALVPVSGEGGAEAPRPLPEGNAYVRGLLAEARNREAALDRYTYDEHETREELDGAGRVKKTTSRLYRVFSVRGKPVRRLMARDGRPLDAPARIAEERRVADKVRRFETGGEGDEPPGLRLSDIVERYDFESVAREQVDGRSILVLSFAARPGKSALPRDQVFRALSGTLRVDEADGQIERLEARNSSSIKFALGLGAKVTTATLTVTFAPARDGVWLPRRLEAGASGRILVLKGFRTRVVSTYENYQRFDVEADEHVEPAA